MAREAAPHADAVSFAGTDAERDDPPQQHDENAPAADSADDEDDVDIQQAAIIAEPAEPRRGWWNRFVRKSD